MSNRFLNDHKIGKVEIHRILKITAGGFHAWVDSNVGRIRKPINALVKLSCWFEFKGLSKPEELDITSDKPVILSELKEIHFERWYEKWWHWLLKLLRINL